MMTVKEVLEEIDKMVVLAKECDDRNDHKLQYSNPYSREIERLVVLLELLELPYNLHIDNYGSGMFIINRRYIVAPRSGKWRVKGKNTWYWYKTPTNLVEKYILKVV